MARRDFVSIGPIPSTTSPELARWLESMLQNVELLAKLRGNSNNAAVLKGDISADYPAAISAGTSAATLVALAAMTTTIANDLKAMQATLNFLMQNMKT